MRVPWLVLLAGCTLPKGFRGAFPAEHVEQDRCLSTEDIQMFGGVLAAGGDYGEIVVQWAGAEFDCEADLVAWVKPHGRTLDVLVHPEDFEQDSGCTCLWNLAITVAGLTPGDVLTVVIWGWLGEGDPERGGSAEVVVPPANR